MMFWGVVICYSLLVAGGCRSVGVRLREEGRRCGHAARRGVASFREDHVSKVLCPKLLTLVGETARPGGRGKPKRQRE